MPFKRPSIVLVLILALGAIADAATVGRQGTPYFWPADDTAVPSILNATTDPPTGNCLGTTMPNGLIAVLGSIWHRPGTGNTWDCYQQSTPGQSAWKLRTAAVSPSGPTGAIQFNAGGTLGGSADLVWDDVLNTGGATGSWGATTFLQDGNPVLDSQTAGACTNQFVRAINTNTAPTCSSVQTNDIADGAVTASKLAAGLQDPVSVVDESEAAHTGTTAETIVYSRTIPANTLSTSRGLWVRFTIDITAQGTTVSSVRPAFNGTYWHAGFTRNSTGAVIYTALIVPISDSQARVSAYLQTNIGSGSSAAHNQVISFDRTIDRTLEIRFTLGTTTDSWQLTNLWIQTIPSSPLGAGGGTGDITAVGDCASGDCFASGTPDQFFGFGASGPATMRTLPSASASTAGVIATGAQTLPTGRKTFSPDSTTPGLNVGSVSSDPSSPSNGDIWYNSTTNQFRCRQGGSSVNCIGTGGGSSLTMRESDGNPTVNGVTDIIVPNNSLTDNGGGSVTFNPPGGSGGGARFVWKELPAGGCSLTTASTAMGPVEQVVSAAGRQEFVFFGLTDSNNAQWTCRFKPEQGDTTSPKWNGSDIIVGIEMMSVDASPTDTLQFDVAAHCLSPGVDIEPSNLFTWPVSQVTTSALTFTTRYQPRRRTVTIAGNNINGTPCAAGDYLILAVRINPAGTTITEGDNDYVFSHEVGYTVQ